MISPIPGSDRLLSVLTTALTPKRLPLLIGVDGRWGAGKSSVASWLAWQLGMPAVSLDLYMIRDSKPLEWRSEDLGPEAEQANRGTRNWVARCTSLTM